MSSQMKDHLKKSVEDSMKQKVRMKNMIEDYEAQERKTNKRILDENELEKQLRLQLSPQSTIKKVIERIEADKEVLHHVQGIIGESKQEVKDLMLTMNAHLEELTEIELKSTGHMMHFVGVHRNTEYNETENVIVFKGKGRAEMPISARVSHWKDTSQMKIRKIQKKEVE